MMVDFTKLIYEQTERVFDRWSKLMDVKSVGFDSIAIAYGGKITKEGLEELEETEKAVNGLLDGLNIHDDEKRSEIMRKAFKSLRTYAGKKQSYLNLFPENERYFSM